MNSRAAQPTRWELARDKVFQVFHDDIHSPLVSAYRSYLDNVGEPLNDALYNSYLKLSPKMKVALSKLKVPDNISKLPAPIKIMYEKISYGVWATLYTSREVARAKSTEAGSFAHEGIIIFKAKAGIIKAPPEEQNRLESILESLRPYSLDKEMGKCLKVHAVPVPYELAVNTGCHIYIFKEMYDNYSDAQLRSVISHEMIHSFYGDNLKQVAFMALAGAKHISKLGIEEMTWLLTDEQMEYLARTGQEGNLVTLTETLNKSLQSKELRADRLGVIMLNNAGFSGEDALSALRLSAGVRAGEEPKVEPYDYSDSHPPTYVRYNIIKQNMKF